MDKTAGGDSGGDQSGRAISTGQETGIIYRKGSGVRRTRCSRIGSLISLVGITAGEEIRPRGQPGSYDQCEELKNPSGAILQYDVQ